MGNPEADVAVTGFRLSRYAFMVFLLKHRQCILGLLRDYLALAKVEDFTV